MKAQVGASVATEGVRLAQAHGDTIAQVKASTQNGRAQVTGQKQTKTHETTAAADEQLAALKKAILDRQAEMRKAGETKAQSAEQLGEMEAVRALSGTRERATKALMLGNLKAARYHSYKRAADIAETVRNMASRQRRTSRKPGLSWPERSGKIRPISPGNFAGRRPTRRRASKTTSPPPARRSSRNATRPSAASPEWRMNRLPTSRARAAS